MSSHVRGVGGVGLKVVTAYKENMVRFGLPSILATLFLFKPTTGELVAVMDGSHLTAMRTAAGSALATRYLSRPDSRSLGIIGAGVQARTHLAAIAKVRDLKSVLVYGPDPVRVRAFVDDFSTEPSLNVSEARSARQVVEESDILVTATTSGTPVFKGEWLRQGTHINSIMSIRPTMRELDDRTISLSRIVVDDVESVLHEAGDIIQPIERGMISRDDICSLGDIIIGRREGRRDSEEITLFKSVGVPSHDVCVASLVYEKATKSGVGLSLKMQ